MTRHSSSSQPRSRSVDNLVRISMSLSLVTVVLTIHKSGCHVDSARPTVYYPYLAVNDTSSQDRADSEPKLFIHTLAAGHISCMYLASSGAADLAADRQYLPDSSSVAERTCQSAGDSSPEYVRMFVTLTI